MTRMRKSMKKSDQGANRATRKADIVEGKQRWSEPSLRRMKAGSAEVGTRATGDGAFTTS